MKQFGKMSTHDTLTFIGMIFNKDFDVICYPKSYLKSCSQSLMFRNKNAVKQVKVCKRN